MKCRTWGSGVFCCARKAEPGKKLCGHVEPKPERRSRPGPMENVFDRSREGEFITETDARKFRIMKGCGGNPALFKAFCKSRLRLCGQGEERVYR